MTDIPSDMMEPKIYMGSSDAPDLVDEIGIICLMAAYDFDDLGIRPSWSVAHAVWIDPDNEMFGNESFSINVLGYDRAGDIYMAEWDRLVGIERQS